MASYRKAIEWLAENDDNGWLSEDCGPSVAAALVADLFGKADRDVRGDLIKYLLRKGRVPDRPFFMPPKTYVVRLV